MQRSFRTRTVLCLLPTLIATALVVRAYLKDPETLTGFKRGIDLSGGTILVYEVDQDASKQNRASDAGPGRATADTALAESLKRRIDPTDLLSVVIRPLGQTRVEIILPYGVRKEGAAKGTNEAEVEKVKGLIREVGSLEFRILANDMDDSEALKAARDYFARARDNPTGPEATEMQLASKAGQPPPFPNRTGDADPFIYNGESIRYEWVELGKHSRAENGLSADPNAPAARRNSGMKAALAQARETSDGIYVVESPHEKGKFTTIYYSRPTLNERDPLQTAEIKQNDYFVLSRISEKNRLSVGGDVTITANVADGSDGGPVVGFNFNSRGGDRFYEITNNNKPSTPENQPGATAVVRQLGIVLDGYLISSPSLNVPIRGSGVIEGKFERSEVERIVNLLRSGALPATLKPLPVSENTIGPTLGADTIRNGTLSVLLAFGAVLAFMIVYYRFAGVVATIALLANLLLTIGFMQAVDATFTLPGMAGLVLMLGMAVDANVLIYERVREERDRGMNLQTALRNGYDRALPTIIDTHLSSIFTCIVLYTVGNDQLKGFAVSLTVGLVISLFTSLYMTRLIFDFWQHKGWLTQLRMMRLFSRPNLDFMKIRHPVFLVTAVLTIAGLALFLARGEKGLNVDFVGGTAFSGRLAKPMDIKTLRDTLSEERQRERLAGVVAEEISDQAGKNKNTYELTYKDGEKRLIVLANAPDGTTKEERERNVTERATVLRDASVEQIFRGGTAGNESEMFTVRSTEREREIVETTIARLFRDPDGTTQLSRNAITDVTKRETDYLLTFEKPVSVSTIKTLFDRQFQQPLGAFAEYASDVFDIQPDGEAVDGSYTKMRLRILKEANDGIRALSDQEIEKGVIEPARASFAARPQPERLETFDGTLAAETRSRALYAIVASWVAIMLYLWFRFGNWTFGAAAVVCLIHDLCFTLGVIAACHFLHDTTFGQLLGLKDFKIDLPAVAALLTLVGYSVNDTIVVFDRIKEVRGKNPALTPAMINDSVNQTLSRTILASLTTFLVVIVLYIFGGDGVHLFAFVMVIGVIIGTISSIYVASPLLLLFGEGRGHTNEAVTA